jgi:Zinc finger, C2H2 type
MQYLTFNCFEADLSHDDILRFVKSGYYAFLDHASLHWYHHLEAALVSLKSSDFGHSAELSMAINEFFEMYELSPMQQDKELIERCSAIEDAECYESLLLLLSHARACRIAEEKLEALGALGKVVTKTRTILEELSACATLDVATKQELEQFYGDKWHKCSRHACYYFHEGFANERGLLQHIDRHEKPFCCTEMGCTRMYIGWSTEKELKRHMSQYHPDPEAFSWKFPHVKKPPTKFQCKLCEKAYSRANSLTTHQLREHAKERPFICKTCSKGFVRKYELDRHESIHKNKSARSSQADTQENAQVGGSSQ